MGSVVSSVAESAAMGAGSSAVSGVTRTTTYGRKNSRQLAIPNTTFKYASVGFFSILLGLLFYFIFKKQSDFGMDAVGKIIISIALLVMAVVITQSFKLNTLDFLISSEINILCMYLLLCYIGFTYAVFSNPLDNLISFIKDLFSVLTDPTYIYSKGFSLLLPIIFFVINALITLGISIAVVYFLYPKNDVVPITGGSSAGLSSSSSDCVHSYASYLNPFNFGKPHC